MRFCRRGHHFDAVSMKKRGLGWNIGELGFGEGGGYEREEEWGGGFGFGEPIVKEPCKAVEGNSWEG